MKIQCRGWNRNHGWRDLAEYRLKDAQQDSADDPVPHNNVSIVPSDRPYDRPNGGSLRLYFKVDVTQPLNGEYMFNLSLSRKDIARLFRMSAGNASVDQWFEMLNSVPGLIAANDVDDS